MAPEVINENEKGYDAKCDIWSIGITAIEMAELKPPYSAIHPMRAIFVIPNREPPKFQEPKKWSEEFNDFIKQCLIKNPDDRWAAKDLLKHKFVKKAKSNKILVELIDKTRQIIIEAGGKEKFYEKEKIKKEQEKLEQEKKKKKYDSENSDDTEEEEEEEDDNKNKKKGIL
jgi:serine/threonine kinase 4